jgi:hypothetical protein
MACKIKEGISFFIKNHEDSDGEKQQEWLEFIVECLEHSQSIGKLSLKEAWMIQNAIGTFQIKNDLKTLEKT